MSFKADVLRVLIASPSDVENERNEIEEAILNGISNMLNK